MAPQDPKSIELFKDDKVSVDFLNNQKSLYEETEKLEKFVGKTEEFAALFYVGGQGRTLPSFTSMKPPSLGKDRENERRLTENSHV